jgi:hypothetical protein
MKECRTCQVTYFKWSCLVVLRRLNFTLLLLHSMYVWMSALFSNFNSLILFYSFVFILFCIKENHPRFMNIPYVKIKIIFEHLHFFKQIYILFYELICHRNDVFDIKNHLYLIIFYIFFFFWLLIQLKNKKINYLFLFNHFENSINVLLFELQKLTSF